ncbi:PROTEIN PAM68 CHLOROPLASTIC [Salix purpurea]|uniref:PROTEIN PAM68 CHLOROPLASTIC n=1 Tax=Salix purpurea TaxID=77065 RepID=A0A9Q0TIA5_SALPP|nr:PROTEIN PAM68 CHLOROPLASTIC [Salix purpurea]
MAEIAAGVVRLSSSTPPFSWPYKVSSTSFLSKIDRICERASSSPSSLVPAKQSLQFPVPVPRSKNTKKSKPGNDEDDNDDDDGNQEEEEPDAGVIPEVVTNRMMTRVGISVGAPLFVGLLFFPFFYYLKVGLKIDVPTWVPFIVSFFFFGSALLGVSYGIVSSSWDPMREGSFWGWNEAQKNWPVFWQSLRGRPGKN